MPLTARSNCSAAAANRPARAAMSPGSRSIACLRSSTGPTARAVSSSRAPLRSGRAGRSRRGPRCHSTGVRVGVVSPSTGLRSPVSYPHHCRTRRGDVRGSSMRDRRPPFVRMDRGARSAEVTGRGRSDGAWTLPFLLRPATACPTYCACPASACFRRRPKPLRLPGSDPLDGPAMCTVGALQTSAPTVSSHVHLHGQFVICHVRLTFPSLPTSRTLSMSHANVYLRCDRFSFVSMPTHVGCAMHPFGALAGEVNGPVEAWAAERAYAIGRDSTVKAPSARMVSRIRTISGEVRAAADGRPRVRRSDRRPGGRAARSSRKASRRTGPGTMSTSPTRTLRRRSGSCSAVAMSVPRRGRRRPRPPSRSSRPGTGQPGAKRPTRPFGEPSPVGGRALHRRPRPPHGRRRPHVGRPRRSDAAGRVPPTRHGACVVATAGGRVRTRPRIGRARRITVGRGRRDGRDECDRRAPGPRAPQGAFAGGSRTAARTGSRHAAHGRTPAHDGPDRARQPAAGRAIRARRGAARRCLRGVRGSRPTRSRPRRAVRRSGAGPLPADPQG
ncbi:hypothetical protein ABIA38_003431 [Embleya sp. AB8]